MHYQNIQLAYFIERPNRFIAYCALVETGEVVKVHVKNTGRGKEVLLPKVLVALQYVPSSTRKTAYDLIAVKKGEAWFNIDSLVPNFLAFEGVRDQQIQLPGLKGEIRTLKREVTFDESRFDLYFETDQEKGFIEVKGMTLENFQVGAFPDAPTIRGEKHVRELIKAHDEGYRTYLLFIAQFSQIQVATVHRTLQPSFYQAIKQAEADGVPILTYNCHVGADFIELANKVPFDVEADFIDPVAK